MRNKTLFVLFIILSVSFLLRFWEIDKPGGLWYDEYISVRTASIGSFDEFMRVLLNNCHTPLYYLFLKFWLSIFPDTDVSLRVSSLVISLLTVITMFFAGRELKNEKTGLFCAFFCALSSFYIYFAQEVRLYSLLSLVSSLIVFMCIKTLKTGNKIHFYIFILLNAVLAGVHTLGVIFSFFLILFTLIYLYKNFDEWKQTVKNVESLLRYTFPLLCALFILAPFLFSTAFSKNLAQFWSSFSFSKIVLSFTDLFSPVQINILNSPNNLNVYFFKDGGINSGFVFFDVIPAVIAIAAILRACFSKDKILNVLIYSSVCFLAVITALSASGKMIFLTKYISGIYPVLILAFASGMLSFKNKIIKNCLFALYFGITAFYLIFSPYAAQKLPRLEGHKIPADLIERQNLKPDDFIILTYYDLSKFERYLDTKKHSRILSIDKFNFNDKIYGNKDYYGVVKNGKILYREQLKKTVSPNAVKWAYDNVITHMKPGDRAVIIFLDSVSFMPGSLIKHTAEDDAKYNAASFIFMTFSMLKNSLRQAFDTEEFKLEAKVRSGSWTMFVYRKI